MITRRSASSTPGAAPSGKRKGISVRKVDDYLRFTAFLMLIGMAYIWNSYRAEAQIKEFDALKREVRQLKSRYQLKEATLAANARRMIVSDLADTLGLYAGEKAPYRIFRGLEVPESRFFQPERLPLGQEIAPDSLAPGSDSLPAWDSTAFAADSSLASLSHANPQQP